MTRKLPADDQVLLALARTETHAQIAARYGCTRQAVSNRLRNAGRTRDPNARAHQKFAARAMRLYALIIRYKSLYDGCTPPYRWLARQLDNASSSTITSYVRELERRGLITRRAGRQILVTGARWQPPAERENPDDPDL